MINYKCIALLALVFTSQSLFGQDFDCYKNGRRIHCTESGKRFEGTIKAIERLTPSYQREQKRKARAAALEEEIMMLEIERLRQEIQRSKQGEKSRTPI